MKWSTHRWYWHERRIKVVLIHYVRTKNCTVYNYYLALKTNRIIIWTWTFYRLDSGTIFNYLGTCSTSCYARRIKWGGRNWAWIYSFCPLPPKKRTGSEKYAHETGFRPNVGAPTDPPLHLKGHTPGTNEMVCTTRGAVQLLPFRENGTFLQFFGRWCSGGSVGRTNALIHKGLRIFP